MEILKILVNLMVVFLLTINTAEAQNLQLQEKEIQAGLIYNFLKYTNWPDSKKGNVIKVCIIGSDPFDGYLEPLGKRTVKQKNIVIDSVKNAGEVASCDIAISGRQNDWTELNATAAANSILTVSTTRGFSDNGGMIEFGRSGNHISVFLNIKNLKNANLEVESRMLKLVTVVGSGN